MVSANTVLRDKALAHAHAIARFQNGEIKRIVAGLNRDTYPALVEELQKRLARIDLQGFDRGVESTKRLRDMLKALNVILDEGFGKAEDKLTKNLEGFAEIEGKVARKQLLSAITIEMEVALPSPEILRALVTSKPFAGELLSDHFANLTASTQKALRRGLNIGLTSGETFDQITARVQGTRALRFRDGLVEMSRRQVRSIVGSAVQHVGASARAATYRENADLIKGEVWIATLDSKTCPSCIALEKKHGPKGEPLPLGEGPTAPLHLGPCRCQRVPVMKGIEELGLDPEDFTVSTRASMDGEVPADTTYSEWIKSQPAHVQDEALGPARAAMLRSGEVDVEDFVNDQGRLLTLEDLRRQEGLD